MSETASFNKIPRTIKFETPSEDVSESSEGGLEGPSQNNVSPVNEGGFWPFSENSKPPFGEQSDERIENLVDLFREFLEAVPNPATSNSTHTQRTTTGRKRLFGLNKGLSPETGSNNPYDYEQKYPRDRPGEEAADNARVWLTYLDEAESFDRERVEGWKDTVDVLLVFAGLFSGVITTFVSQASQSLQQDNTQVSASLLFEITRLLRAQSNGTPLNNITSSPLTPTSPFTPSTNALLVNGLWFTSLAIALSTALFTVLAKQWLHYYLTSITGTAQEKVRARQLRFKGFESWNVGAIVELLPILLYTAVGMFLTGIIILLFPLDVRVAWTLVVITGITYVLYFISVLLPIRYPECPYTTSLTIYIGILVFALREILHWVGSKNFEKGFQAVWRRINLNTRHTIRRFLHNTLRLINARLLYTMEFIRRRFQKLQPTIFANGFPKFTNWREDNIKTAVKDAGFLDFEALYWLYGTSLNRSVHRIIARCAAVYPGIFWEFDYEIRRNLDRTLEISETNLVDLRYGLCMDSMLGNECGHWCLLRSIPDAEEADTDSYRSYGYIAENMILLRHRKILKYVISNHLKLPLVMWSNLFERASGDATIAAHILTSGMSGLFEGKCDPIRGFIPNAGVVSFNSEELGWWKFRYLYYYYSPLDRFNFFVDYTFETRFRLLVTIYRHLTTSDHPLIADIKQRQQSLSILFSNFRDWLDTKPQRVSFKQYFAFFIDVCGADAFWSESMTNRGRRRAVQCLESIWRSMDTDVANQFPFTECDDLTPIYQWCSRDDLNSYLSWRTTPISILLFMSQNRTCLFTILSRDPDAVSHLTNCFRNMRSRYGLHFEMKCVLSNLMDLLKSVNPKEPLFNILYDSSVLVKLWMFLLFEHSDAKKFLLVVRSRLDQEKLNNLHAAMAEEVRSSKRSRIHQGFKRSVHEFGQMIGMSHLQLESATEQSAPEHTLDKDHDTEERPHVPDANERGERFIANWTNQAFRFLRLKIRSGNRDQDVDVELI